MTRVAVLSHFFYPWRAAGSETCLLELLKAAVAAGHHAEVWCTHQTADRVWRGNLPDTQYEGITVHRMGNQILAARAMARTRPDVVVTHHQHAVSAIKTAHQINARSVLLTHNDFDINQRPLRAHPTLTIHNSEWVKKSLSRFGQSGESMVMHPPLTPDRHTVPSTGESATLINLNSHKGSSVFYELAERMPERSFLGVIGGHGQQVIRRNLPNVTIVDHNPDMRRVWSQTRVLLMPSVYESYGLTAVEAGLNGIPTIAHPTPGLRENLGTAGTFADRDHIKEWVHRLQEFDNPLAYAEASENARILADDALTATRATLKQWVEWLG